MAGTIDHRRTVVRGVLRAASGDAVLRSPMERKDVPQPMDENRHPEALRPEDGAREIRARLPGPRAWPAVLAVESARCRRYGRPATVAVVEISLPTGAGDEPASVLKASAAVLGSALLASCRSSDHAFRVSRYRFAIILPETDEIAAVNFVERIRLACDEGIRSVVPGARARFGWADASVTRSLLEAFDTAVARLADDEDPPGDAASRRDEDPPPDNDPHRDDGPPPAGGVDRPWHMDRPADLDPPREDGPPEDVDRRQDPDRPDDG